ncbi:MAG: hypothetical protein MUC88_19835 [Planctomycetes bacterium]|nr:hypothetical protein [Planctomycetota bacterium]
MKPVFQPTVPDEDKAALLYKAQLDLLRILICSDEIMIVNGEQVSTDVMRQQTAEHFSNLGFRVLDGSPGPSYDVPADQLGTLANQRDVDMFVLLRGRSKQVDKFGNFYSFEAEGRAKVAQISGNELLTTQSAFVRGKRGLNVQQAAESALTVCGDELAKKCSDEILRKRSGRQTRGAIGRPQQLGSRDGHGHLLGSFGCQCQGEPGRLPGTTAEHQAESGTVGPDRFGFAQEGAIGVK